MIPTPESRDAEIAELEERIHEIEIAGVEKKERIEILAEQLKAEQEALSALGDRVALKKHFLAELKLEGDR